MRKNHWLVKEDNVWVPGRSLGTPQPPRYDIEEHYIGSEGNEARRFVCSFDSEALRDQIFDAMVHAGLCTHSKLPSWVRSVHRVSIGWKMHNTRLWKHPDGRVINVIKKAQGEWYETVDSGGHLYNGESFYAAMEAKRETRVTEFGGER
jgi:hypothetical protein